MRTGLVAPAAVLAVLALVGCGAGAPDSSTAGDVSTRAVTTITDSPAPGGSQTATEASPRASRTRGYATYEACQGACTGSVPASLRRRLRLPTGDGGPCPITVHAAGPVGPRQISAGVGFHTAPGSAWLGAQVTWVAAGSYRGPILIRGARLGGGALGFGSGARPYDELQLLDAGRGAPAVAGNGRAWVTYTRIPSAGCYAYQVDGTTFSEVVVFRAVG